MIAATAVASVMSYGAVSLPGEVSFISSIAPIAMALGVPIAPLALLVAVEMIPDIFRTLGNVTLDVAVTAAVDRVDRGRKSGRFRPSGRRSLEPGRNRAGRPAARRRRPRRAIQRPDGLRVKPVMKSRRTIAERCSRTNSSGSSPSSSAAIE